MYLSMASYSLSSHPDYAPFRGMKGCCTIDWRLSYVGLNGSQQS